MTARNAAVVAVLLAALGLGLGLGLGLRSSDRGGTAMPGHPAPAFTAPVARGGTFTLARQRSHPVLLAFLDTQAGATAANDPSRAQIPFLRSMNTQNHPYGLRTVVVDTARADHSALVNFTYDWALDPSIVVVGDAHGSIARAYGVAAVPTTFLVDARGRVRRRWDGFARAADLDFAVRPLVGRPIVGAGTTTSG
jgi:cytochrome c biogenesis protein CcmG, thiol:disulfide interchange protein DsbE